MKILLVSSNVAETPYPVYPLGISIIAQVLKKEGYTVEQFDFLQNEKSFVNLSTKIVNYSPDIIGISMRNIDNVNFLNEKKYIDIVKKIIQTIKKQTKSPIVLGGSAFSIMPESILNKVKADYGIVGEGEKLILEFVDNIKNGIFPKGKILKSNNRIKECNISSAYYDSDIMDFYLKKGNIISIQTKRGCINNCIYCSYPFLEGNNIRCRDVTSVVNDIEKLINVYKIKYIFFVDSVFNDEKEHYVDLIREIKKRKIYIPWTAFFQPKNLTNSIIKLMKQTGLKSAEIGSDASSDETLQALNKKFSFKDIVNCNDLFVDNEISTAHYYMFGGPKETKKTVKKGINNILSLKNTVSFMFMGIRILPGTRLFDLAIKEKFISETTNMLNPIYYIASGIDKKWLYETLYNAFKGKRNCIFPPDVLDNSLSFLHKLGYTGSLWDMLLSKKRKNK